MTWQILVGDVREQLTTLPAASVHCVVTSPPYWGLRDYGVEGQLGLEATPDAYVAAMVEVFQGVKRVLRPDGTLWLNLGDSYFSTTKGSGGPSDKQESNAGSWYEPRKFATPGDGIKTKDLVGIPWRVAFALQADGWYLRSDIIWAKPNPMPESVTDRPTKAHEYLFLLAKSADYFFDQEAVREPQQHSSIERAHYRLGGFENGKLADKNQINYVNNPNTVEATQQRALDGQGRNLRTVWTIPTQPYREAHFATFPEKLVEPCIKAGTSEKGCCAKCGAPWEREVKKTFVQEGATRNRGAVKSGDEDAKSMTMGDGGKIGHNNVETTGWHPTCPHEAEIVPCTVLDPFCGSGTTGVVALKLDRSFIGIELNPSYVTMARRRLGTINPLFTQEITR